MNVRRILAWLKHVADIRITRSEFFLLGNRADRDAVESAAPGTTEGLRIGCAELGVEACSKDMRGLGFVIYIVPWASDPEGSLVHELLRLEAIREEVPESDQEEWVNRVEADCYDTYLSVAGGRLSSQERSDLEARIQFLRTNAEAARDAGRRSRPTQ